MSTRGVETGGKVPSVSRFILSAMLSLASAPAYLKPPLGTTSHMWQTGKTFFSRTDLSSFFSPYLVKGTDWLKDRSETPICIL